VLQRYVVNFKHTDICGSKQRILNVFIYINWPPALSMHIANNNEHNG
jgi:hypothetical protein